MQASEVIKHEYGNSGNFMTPDVIKYGWVKKDKLAYEISSGTDFSNEPIYGLSIVKVVTRKPLTTERMIQLSGMFRDLDELRGKIEELAMVAYD